MTDASSRRRLLYEAIFLTWCTLANLINSQENSAGDSDQATEVLDNVTCEADSDCNLSHYKSSCLNISSISNDSKVCVCDAQGGFYSINGTCMYRSLVDEFCIVGSTVCRDSSAICQSAGDGQGLTRCECVEGTHKIYTRDATLCVQRLTTEISEKCRECVNNNGLCYDTNMDQDPDGCLCPSAFSGEACEKVHVNVTCSVKYMDVCYEPHPGFDLSSSAWLHVDGHGDVGACRAWPDEARCGIGNYWLRLPLADDQINRCGTKKEYSAQSGKRTYSNQLVVQKSGYQTTSSDIYFRTFCSFTQLHTMTIGYNIDSLVGSEIGHSVLPFLVLTVKNTLEQTIPPNIFVRPGDLIFYNVYLKPSNGYSAIKVEFCTISNSGKAPDHAARSHLVIDNGCPAENQIFINGQNNWRRYLGKPHELQTGIVQVFPLDSSPNFFLHCTLKLCVMGHEGNCQPSNCSEGGRRKREVETSNTTRFASVQTQINLEMPSQDITLTNASSLQMVVIVCIVALLVVVSGLCALTAYSLRSKGYSGKENKPDRIFLFHWPSSWYKLFYNDDFPSYVSESKV